jgi:predicted ATPase
MRIDRTCPWLAALNETLDEIYGLTNDFRISAATIRTDFVACRDRVEQRIWEDGIHAPMLEWQVIKVIMKAIVNRTKKSRHQIRSGLAFAFREQVDQIVWRVYVVSPEVRAAVHLWSQKLGWKQVVLCLRISPAINVNNQDRISFRAELLIRLYDWTETGADGYGVVISGKEALAAMAENSLMH